jgi:hypothetical protein
MKLPAELRNRIYQFALVADNELLIDQRLQKKPRRRVACRYYHKRDKPTKKYKADINSNLLLINKQVYQEAIGILYGQPIKFMTLDALLYFLSQIGKFHTEILRSITIDHIVMGREAQITHGAFTALLNATHLTSLDICAIDRRYSEREYVTCDHGIKDLAASFFYVAHVWVEQMKRYRSDQKGWEDVLVLAQGASFNKDRCWSGERFELHSGMESFTKEEFQAEIYRLLRE